MAKNPTPTPSRKSAAPKNADGAGKAVARKKPAEDDALPDEEGIQAALAPVTAFDADTGSSRIRDFLTRLCASPPQVLLLEGGYADARLAAAHYWALLLNCEAGAQPARPAAPQASLLPGLAPPPVAPADENAAPPDIPCFACNACIRMVTHMHRDLFFLDGRQASIKIDDVRALKSVLGEPPREAKRRVVIFCEAQALGEAAANSLLKVFEEPAPDTSFVLLAPQRERLLPTLVSRSFALTLPWPLAQDAKERERLIPWEAALCSFLTSGRELFELTGARGAVDAPLAHSIIGMCRRALAACLMGGNEPGQSYAEGLERVLARMPKARLRMLDEALAECQDSLIYGVNPTLVLEWLATRMYLLLPRR